MGSTTNAAATVEDSDANMTQNYQRLVEFQHCHQMTPVGIHMNDNVASANADVDAASQMTTTTTTPTSIVSASNVSRMMHPATSHYNSNNNNTISPTSTTNNNDIMCMNHGTIIPPNNNNYIDDANYYDKEDEEGMLNKIARFNVQQGALEARIQTELALTESITQWEVRYNLFAACTLPPDIVRETKKKKKKAKPKQSAKLEQLITTLSKTSPHFIVSARSSNMGNVVPNGLNVLQAACHVGNVEIVQYLLEHYVDTTPIDVGDVGESGEPDAYGNVRGEEENEEVIPKLDLNAVDDGGRTALHIASNQGHKKVIGLLERAYAAIHGQQDDDVENQPRQGDDDDRKVLAEDENGESKLTSKTTPTPPTTATRTPKTPMASSSSSHHHHHRQTMYDTSQQMMSFRSQLMPIHTGLPMLSSSLYTKKATTPTFAGPRAPVDLSGFTPLAYVLTSSSIGKDEEKQAELEKLLYQPGDPSIVGHGGRAKHTPASARCGPSTPSSSSSKSSLLSPMAAASTARRAENSSSRTPPINNASSYLIPTPNHNNEGYLLSPHVLSSSGRSRRHHNHHHPSATPQCSTIYEEDLIDLDDNNMVYSVASTTVGVGVGGSSNSTTQRMKNSLQWGYSEMNGFRIYMEDKILVKYEMYGEDEVPPPLPPSLLGTDIHTELAAAAAVTTTSDPISMGLFGVFDGHGGEYASHYVATHLYDTLVAQPEWAVAYHNCNLESNTTLLSSIITQACHDIDEKLRNEKTKPSKDCGSTAIMALVCNRYLFVANVGDSRCILVTKKKTTQTKAATTNAEDDEVAATTASGSTGSKPCWQSPEIDVTAMSEDHKAHLPDERARIKSAGLTVQPDPDYVPSDNDPTTAGAISRVWISEKVHLGTSRAFGDYDFKSNSEISASEQAVICTPEIVVREREEDEDMYLILACDGIWDVMSNQEVGEFVAGKVAERLHYSSINTNNLLRGKVLAQVGDDLTAECLKRGSRDNMSVLIVAFSASGLNSSALSLATMEKESKVADVSSSLFPFE